MSGRAFQRMNPAESRVREGIWVHGLTKRYGDRLAVDEVGLHVVQGTCLGLLGPNGAGKSTTLSMLAGVIPVDSGVICYGAKLNPSNAKVRRSLGFVPQSIALYQDLTAEENLGLFARLHGVTSRQLEARVYAGLVLAGLVEHRSRRVRSFSGGMQRRLNLACATLHAPQYLLLDEPTVGVDPHSREHIFSAIEQLKSAGVTIVYSTHYMEEAERLCDEIAIMDQGRIIAAGTKDELLKLYGGPFRVEAELYTKPNLRVAGSGGNFAQSEPVAAQTLSFECATAAEALPRLLREGDELSQLSIRGPTLETVFLALTGRSLRDG